MSDQTPLLRIRGLSIDGRSERGWSKIVENIDLDLHRGEVLGLIGESGAGKSTLGLAAMGYTRDGCRISAGQVLFDGHDLASIGVGPRRRLRGRRMAYVAQSAAASFNPAHRLINQYCEGPLVHGVCNRAEATQGAIGMYGRMQLPEPELFGLRYPHQVSGGQLQRAMTAMAMACKPDLIVFDEPTTALDVTTQIEVLAAIRDVVRQFGTAAIYISHDLAVVAQMADRIMVLRYGDPVEEADTRTMLSTPREDYTRSLWAVRNFVASAKPARAAEATPVLSLEGVSASYGKVPVLHDIGFSVHAGRTVAVVGESGSGKSTAARCVTGLLPPAAGRVLFKGEALPPRLADRSKEQLRQIQMIYQSADTALNPRQRVREIIGRPVAFYLGLRGKALEERVRALLAAIELEPDQYIDRLPGELSGGQKQRIGIARALAAEPACIICDEVTSALDQLVAEGILRLLDKVQQEFHLAYMFITHDLATVRSIADEVVVMQRGRVVEARDKAGLFDRPEQPYTERLLASVPEMDPDWLDRVLDTRLGA